MEAAKNWLIDSPEGRVMKNDRRAMVLAIAALIFLVSSFEASARDFGQGWSCGNPANQKLDQGSPAGAPPNVGQLKNWLREYRYCGQYDADVAAVLQQASDYVTKRMQQATKPAVVLDIDETSLSNWVEIEQDDFAFVAAGACQIRPGLACGDYDWELSARAEAIQPTFDFYNALKKQSIPVFFVTGRYNRPDLRAATEKNLKAAGYEDWTGLVMRSAGSPSVRDFKKKAQDTIAKTYTIIANVGDQWSDLDGDPSHPVDGQFKVPNPFYFIP
jgi:acid phosphatase